ADGTEELVWAMVFREGPIGREALAARIRRGDLDAIFERLLSSGRIRRVGTANGEEFAADHFHVPRDAVVGWEAAVFDHFQAVVKTIAARLRGHAEGPNGRAIGGSTYSFDVWPGHPMELEVLGLLGDLRERTSELRGRVRNYNAGHPR